jgi:type IV secretory pathway VirJ component
MRLIAPKTLIAAAFAVLLGTAASASAVPKDACDMGLVQRLSSGPLLVTRATAMTPSDTFVVLYSGDGGWARADCEFSRGFAARGMPVLGVNSVRYFAKRRTPQGAADDLARWIETYSARWGRPKVILMGYSFGASALPIIAEQLPVQTRARVKEVALAGPGSGAELVLRPRTWFDRLAPDAIPVAPAVARIRDLHVVCVYGRQDAHAACPAFPAGEAAVTAVPGTHRFGGVYDQVVKAVMG